MNRKAILGFSLAFLLMLSIPQSIHAEEKQFDVAFIKPIFTASAYQANGFYAFYGTYDDIPKGVLVQENLNWLDVPVVDEWGYSVGLDAFVSSPRLKDWGIVMGTNAELITDLDVHYGRLFRSDGSIRYKSVVAGFSEYVTSQEYSEYRRYVENGGTLILLDANTFLAEVKYEESTNSIRLVKGHSWSFNGKAAQRDVFRRWKDENSNWIGSIYMPLNRMGIHYSGALANTSYPISIALRTKFGKNVFEGYVQHEQNMLVNPNARIIASWSTEPLPGKVATYELKHGRGRVFHTGVFGDQLIIDNKAFQFMIIAMIKHDGALLEVTAKVAKVSRGRLQNYYVLEIINHSDKYIDLRGWMIILDGQAYEVHHRKILPPRASKLIPWGFAEPPASNIRIFDRFWNPSGNLTNSGQVSPGRGFLYNAFFSWPSYPY